MWAVFSPARTQEKDQWPSVQHVLSVSKKISENQSNRVPSVTLMPVMRCRSAVCCFRIPLACPESLQDPKSCRTFAIEIQPIENNTQEPTPCALDCITHRNRPRVHVLIVRLLSLRHPFLSILNIHAARGLTCQAAALEVEDNGGFS